MGEIGLRKDSEIILVGGLDRSGDYQKSKKKLRKFCWELHSYIYNVGPQDKDEIFSELNVIVNESEFFGTSAKNIREIHQILYCMDCDQPGIKKVLFGHSKGAQVIYEALEDESLAKFFNEKLLSEADITARVQQIRDHIAIFTFGGIQKIPKRFAKVSCNFVFREDHVSTFGYVLTKIHNEDVQMFRIGNENELTTERNDPFSTSVNALLDSSSASESDDNKHFLKEYLDSDMLKKMIVDLLNARAMA